MATGSEGFIDVGDLYADEGRDFPVSVNVPATSDNETSLIKVKCFYKDPLTQNYIVGNETSMCPALMDAGMGGIKVTQQNHTHQMIITRCWYL
ncbi:hypothetical protein Lal_00000295 [Lupinus albus]|nr:hypothetical protein Lal_00000295 [Lupinus albus]